MTRPAFWRLFGRVTLPPSDPFESPTSFRELSTPQSPQSMWQAHLLTIDPNDDAQVGRLAVALVRARSLDRDVLPHEVDNMRVALFDVIADQIGAVEDDESSAS